MNIVILLFDGVTALDPIGAYDPLARLPDTEIVFAGMTGAPCRTGDGFLSLAPSAAIGDIGSADILLVPGGSPDGLRNCMADAALMANIARLDANSAITASVCTGSLMLAAAGLLRGRRAATNWRAKRQLARFGADYSGDRLTRDGKYWTSAGVTAGIDLGLALCGFIAGDEIAAAVELAMEYDPRPPHGTGNPADATAARERIVAEVLRR